MPVCCRATSATFHCDPPDGFKAVSGKRRHAFQSFPVDTRSQELRTNCTRNDSAFNSTLPDSSVARQYLRPETAGFRASSCVPCFRLRAGVARGSPCLVVTSQTSFHPLPHPKTSLALLKFGCLLRDPLPRAWGQSYSPLDALA